MAITILTNPGTYPSAHRPLNFVVSSTNSAVVNFKYVFDVYVNGVIVSRVKIFPETVSGYGIFDAGKIVRNYLATYFKPATTQTVFNYTGTDISVSYDVKFGEDYGGVTYTNLATGSYKAYNYFMPVFRNHAINYFQQFQNSWLSNRNLTNMDAAMDEKCFISFFIPTTDTITATIQKYNQDGTVNGSPSTGAGFSAQTFTLLDVSPGAINTYLGTTFINDTVFKYGVKINYTGASSSELIVFVSCNPRQPANIIHFMNELGGIDTFAFRGVNRMNRVIERKQFQQSDFVLSGTSMVEVDSYKRAVGGSINYNVMQTINFQLVSDYLDSTNYAWVRELATSPDVFIEKTGYFYPITIETTDWSEKIMLVDKMQNVTMAAKFYKTINSQQR